MNQKSFIKKTVFFLILSSLFGVFSTVIHKPMKAEHNLMQSDFSKWDLTPHDAIIINSNDDFVTYGFLGSGTRDEPYLIEDFNITALVTNGVYVRDITKHFEIRNCYVDVNGYGIYLYNVSGFGEIIENYCTFNSKGTRYYV